jgi:MFS family permease
MLGIYYAAPLLGPSLGPLLGGAVTTAWNWRATFFLLTILGGIALCNFFFFTDTFRQERSLTYQAANRHAIERTRRTAERRAAREISDPEKNNAPVVLDPLMVKVTLLDLNPLKPIWSILKRKNNLFVLLPSCECSRPQLPSLTSIHSTAIRFPVQCVLHYLSYVLSCSVQFRSSSSRSHLTLLWFGYVASRERWYVSSTCLHR